MIDCVNRVKREGDWQDLPSPPTPCNVDTVQMVKMSPLIHMYYRNQNTENI